MGKMFKYVVFTGNNPAVPFPHFEFWTEGISVGNVVECKRGEQMFHFRITKIDSFLMTADSVLCAKGAT